MRRARSAGLLCGIVSLGLGAMSAAAQPSEQPVTPAAKTTPSREVYLRLADEVETVLRKDVLGAWFPRTVDEQNGGFRADFKRDWSLAPSGGKFSVFQGRMTWITAQVAMRRPDLRAKYLPYVAHGLAYLNEVMWDARSGGFYWGLDDQAQISPVYGDRKLVYGIAFCLYGASAAAQATKDPKALALAERAFRWLEQYAHDDENGGYHETLSRDGRPLPPDPDAGRHEGTVLAPFPVGYKSMNTHIHLLEAFTELSRVFPDGLLRQRLEELLTIVRDEIAVDPGVMSLYFTSDWRPVPDHDSYGHDVEAAYLMLEAAEALGRPHDPKTERMARKLVDHALAFGWDEDQGGFFRVGTTFGKPEDKDKEWWVQFEGLNSLLLMHETYGLQTDAYFTAFLRQWQFIKERQIDPEHAGVYEMVGPDGVPKNPGKGRIWKAAYHDGRALLNVSERLRELAKQASD